MHRTRRLLPVALIALLTSFAPATTACSDPTGDGCCRVGAGCACATGSGLLPVR